MLLNNWEELHEYSILHNFRKLSFEKIDLYKNCRPLKVIKVYHKCQNSTTKYFRNKSHGKL